MNVLSLFDGISCGMIALERAGIKVNKYYASEIKEDAVKISQSNYPQIIRLGDINKIDFTQFKDIDLLIGGSPCQDLSQAHTERLGLKGNKSSLFWKYKVALEIVRPKYFLLENVSMPGEDFEIISQSIGTYPVKINSSLVSAQLRDRSYWTNIGESYNDLFGNRYCDIKQPKNKHITLQSILTSRYADRL